MQETLSWRGFRMVNLRWHFSNQVTFLKG